ncbi:MAG: MarR family transcriptional regulator [Hyphomonadaceae bacterium]|nr:MarR family transcriptional regulator [Hyphomonadaceae bacterium]
MNSLTVTARRSESSAPREATGREEEFKLSASPSHLLRRADQYAAEIFMKAGLTDGVTLRQTVLLAAIAELEGASQSDLVRATGIDRSTLAEMMLRMEKRGLIARSAAADDLRAKSVKLSRSGRDHLEAALPAMRSVDAALLASLSRARRTGFTAALQSLADAADEAHVAEIADLKNEKKAAKAKADKAEERARKRRKRKKKNRKKR